MVVFVLFLSFFFMAHGQSDFSELTPHRATYKIVLDQNKTEDVENATGWMTIQISKHAQTWRFEQKTALMIYRVDGSVDRILTTIESFEKEDGSHYIFKTRTVQSEGEEDRVEGYATIKHPGDISVVRYTVPSITPVYLPPKTLFPLHHLSKILGDAKKGIRVNSQIVFDGSSETFEPVQVDAVIKVLPKTVVLENILPALDNMSKSMTDIIFGAPIPTPKTLVNLGDNLIDDQSSSKYKNMVNFWVSRDQNTPLLKKQKTLKGRALYSMTMSIYPIKGDMEEGDYTINQTVFQGGITRDMNLDYGSFTVNVVLKEVKFFTSKNERIDETKTIS
jgi:hypothetical protein